jgi:hypothetical protein
MANHKSFEFYTDGSLIGLRTSYCRMGFGWIEPQLNITYKESCIFNLSLTKSESYAILTILLVVPNHSRITIYTDSQNCIQNFNFFTNPLISRRKQLNHNNHLLWTFIIEIMNTKKLDIKLVKVKAHSGNLYNDMADELATQGLFCEPINININAHAKNSTLIPSWNSMGLIETNLRKWMKKVIQARIFNSFIFNTNFAMIQNTFSSIDINWEYTSLWVKRNHVENEITSTRFTKESSYKIKSITHHLPTSDLQKRNYPLLYKNLPPILCPSCEIEKDDNTHIGRCILMKNSINETFADGKDLLTRLLSELEDINITLLKTSMEHLKCLTPLPLDSHSIPDSHHVYLWAHNIVPNELILFLQSYIRKSSIIKLILWKFLDTFSKRLRKVTWQARCNLMKQWEERHNITKRGKKTYNKTFSQKERRQARINNINIQHPNPTDNSKNQNEFIDSSLFRPFDYTRDTKRKIQDRD